MNDDKSIDLKTENSNLTNELIVLRRKYKELDEDRHYVKSLLDAEFEKGIELKKENEHLKSEINMLKTTIGRNEGYIDRLTHKGEWR